jgi:hypothetical protein
MKNILRVDGSLNILKSTEIGSPICLLSVFEVRINISWVRTHRSWWAVPNDHFMQAIEEPFHDKARGLKAGDCI